MPCVRSPPLASWSTSCSGVTNDTMERDAFRVLSRRQVLQQIEGRICTWAGAPDGDDIALADLPQLCRVPPGAQDV